MDTLIKLLGEQWLIGTLQLLIATLIKPQLKDKLLAAGVRATALIPLINILIAFLGFQLLPASAAAAGLLMAVVPIKEGLGVAGVALVQTVMVTGLHSTVKNTLVPVAKAVAGWLFSKLQPWLKK